MYQDTSSPKFSSRNIFLMPKSFRQSRMSHCSLGSESSEKDSEGSDVVFRQKSIVNLASDLLAALALSSPVLASYPDAARSLGWTRASVPCHPIISGEAQHRQKLPPRSSVELIEVSCHPAPPKSPQAPAWPSYPQSTLKDARHRLERAARALCRRWTPVSHPDVLASSRPN